MKNRTILTVMATVLVAASLAQAQGLDRPTAELTCDRTKVALNQPVNFTVTPSTGGRWHSIWHTKSPTSDEFVRLEAAGVYDLERAIRFDQVGTWEVWAKVNLSGMAFARNKKIKIYVHDGREASGPESIRVNRVKLDKLITQPAGSNHIDILAHGGTSKLVYKVRRLRISPRGEFLGYEDMTDWTTSRRLTFETPAGAVDSNLMIYEVMVKESTAIRGKAFRVRGLRSASYPPAGAGGGRIGSLSVRDRAEPQKGPQVGRECIVHFPITQANDRHQPTFSLFVWKDEYRDRTGPLGTQAITGSTRVSTGKWTPREPGRYIVGVAISYPTLNRHYFHAEHVEVQGQPREGISIPQRQGDKPRPSPLRKPLKK